MPLTARTHPICSSMMPKWIGVSVPHSHMPKLQRTCSGALVSFAILATDARYEG